MDFSGATLPNLLGNAMVQTIGASSTGLSGMILGNTAQVGTGATTPTCVASVVCGPTSGTISFTTGTGTLSPGSVIGIEVVVQQNQHSELHRREQRSRYTKLVEHTSNELR